MILFSRARVLPLLLCVLFLSNTVFAQGALDSVKQEMIRFVGNTNSNAGLLFGMYDESIDKLTILTEGAIQRDDDLRVACPTTKPCVSYMVLKEGLNLDSYIDKWFPAAEGYAKADSITLRMLLYNTSGIKDFARVVKIDPYHKFNPMETINLAYKDQPLEFNPGKQYQYSNTNYNILGVILEKSRNKTFADLIKQYFGNWSEPLN